MEKIKGTGLIGGVNITHDGTELDHTDKRSTHINFSLFDQRNSLEQYELRSFSDTIVDPARNYPPPDFLIKISGVGALPRGDMQAIKAKAKMGKTTFAIILIAVLLGFETALLERSKNKRYRVLHIDTEQHIRSVAWRQRMVYRLIEEDPDTPLEEYLTLSLREFSHQERWRLTQEAIEAHKPDLVLLDGVVDMIADYNDPAESKSFISELMAIASKKDCALLCILHENKGKGDNTMRGHLGTELVNKSSEVYQVTRLNDLFTVAQTESRNAPTPDICFSIDSEGLPVLAEEANPAQGRSNLFMERVQIVRKFMQDKEAITHTELYEELMERFGGVSARTSKREIAKMLHADILAKDSKGKYLLNRGKDDLF